MTTLRPTSFALLATLACPAILPACGAGGIDGGGRGQDPAAAEADAAPGADAPGHPDGGGDALETWEVMIAPNWVNDADDPASNYNAMWVYPASPTTPYRSPDSLHQQTRYLLLDPRVTDADGRAGRDEWWFIIDRSWPADYDAEDHGKWGRQVNFHNVAGDAGPGGGVGWGFGDGVSSLALDWLPGQLSPQISIEPMSPDHEHPLPIPERDVFHTYVVHFIAGRTDGSTVRPGAITVWVDGDPTPHIDLAGVDTVQRAKAPDGVFYTQRWMVLWEGDYTSDIQTTARTQLVLTRIGPTFADALADRPRAAASQDGQYAYRGSGIDLGPPYARGIEPRSTDQSRLPPGL